MDLYSPVQSLVKAVTEAAGVFLGLHVHGREDPAQSHEAEIVKGTPSLFIFIYLLAVLVLPCCVWTCPSCGTLASHCSGFSCYAARALDRVGFCSCGAWTQLL